MDKYEKEKTNFFNTNFHIPNSKIASLIGAILFEISHEFINKKL